MVLARNLLLAGLMMAIPMSEAVAVPPPPPSAQMSAKAHDLIAALTSGDPAAYGELLAPDVHVFDNGKQVASNRAEWLRQFVGQTQGEDVSVLMRAISSEEILTV